MSLLSPPTAGQERRVRLHEKYRRTSSSSKTALPIDLPRNSPHVGSFRHAPAAHACDSVKSPPPSTSRRNFISNLVMSQKNLPLNIMALKNLPLSRFTRLAHESDGPVCAICIDPFKDGDQLRNLNCSHCFHRECVDIWLLGSRSDDLAVNGTCPTCRQKAASSPKRKPASFFTSQQPLLLLTAGPAASTAEPSGPEDISSSPPPEEGGESVRTDSRCSSEDMPLGIDIPEYTFLQIGAFLAEGEISSPYLLYCDDKSRGRSSRASGALSAMEGGYHSDDVSSASSTPSSSSSWVVLLGADQARSASSLSSLDSISSHEQ